MDRDVLLEKLRGVLESRGEGVVAAYLYGSRARGSARAGSDVDLAVLWDRPLEPLLDAGPLDL